MMIDLRDLERRHQVLDAVEQRLLVNRRKLQSTQRELEDARKNIIELAPPKLPNDTEKCRVIRAAVSALAHQKREMFEAKRPSRLANSGSPAQPSQPYAGKSQPHSGPATRPTQPVKRPGNKAEDGSI